MDEKKEYINVTNLSTGEEFMLERFQKCKCCSSIVDLARGGVREWLDKGMCTRCRITAEG